ncbi:Gfo/Idh/MocA family oxidoreductase [Streptomyces sp. NPDC004647]|uniref:Gfo/Idh/MocA family oxidoreductase n=1 Tax=Streptomyces sp. NPDC004647 TaxID=3154671 RepID=UPI0033AA9577
MKNILVIGVGPHARRNHLPGLLAGQRAGLVGTVTGVDIPGAAEAIAQFNKAFEGQDIPVAFIDPFDSSRKTLPHSVRETLDSLVGQCAIDAVVISTEPSFHMVYTHWALDHELDVLLDKPLSVHTNCSVDPDRAAEILTDFDEVLAHYDRVREKRPETLVTVQCQRRYHPAFLTMRRLVAEVAAETNCPVTSIQSFHSDGQWRMPNELVDISYHSFDLGYGKCAHSGYHFFDIVPWLLQAGETVGKSLDAVEVHANVTRPGDFLAQLDIGDYERLFPEFAATNPYSESELLEHTEDFGEIDAFVSMAYKSGGRTMTLGSINLVHNGFSQRASVAPVHANLYKGNGRVRHESHIIEQGPFQAIHYHSLQTLGDGSSHRDPDEVGDAEHIEVHVFRNSNFNGRWKKCETLGFDALAADAASHGERVKPTQSASRRRAIQEFLEYINGKRIREQMASELTSHRRSSRLMAGAYLSAARQRSGAFPTAALDFRAQADGRHAPPQDACADAAHDLLDVSL